MLMLTLTEGFLPSPGRDSTWQIAVNEKHLLSAEGSVMPGARGDLHTHAVNACKPTLI